MTEIGVKSLIIGVSLFITMIITSIVIFEFTQIKGVYKGVGQTDISFESRLNEFDKYKDNVNIFSGLDVKNTYSKYKKDDTVDVCVEDAVGETCNDSLEQYIENLRTNDYPNANYSTSFVANLIETNKGYKINFSVNP